MLSATVSGSIEAYNTPQPHISNELKTLTDKVVLIGTSGVYTETCNIAVLQD